MDVSIHRRYWRVWREIADKVETGAHLSADDLTIVRAALRFYISDAEAPGTTPEDWLRAEQVRRYLLCIKRHGRTGAPIEGREFIVSAIRGMSGAEAVA